MQTRTDELSALGRGTADMFQDLMANAAAARDAFTQIEHADLRVLHMLKESLDAILSQYDLASLIHDPEGVKMPSDLRDSCRGLWQKYYAATSEAKDEATEASEPNPPEIFDLSSLKSDGPAL